MPAHIPFNCCTDNKEPDWSQFDGVEVAPATIENEGTDSEHVSRVEPDHPDIRFWAVLGHMPGFGVDAIEDVPTWQEAVKIAEDYRERIAQATGIDPYRHYDTPEE